MFRRRWGQQSAVYGLLGANVTVFDISVGQLKSDEKAAEYYGYKVKLIQGEMQDLSCFNDNTFDIVYQPISIVFVPDVRIVYREVHRVLKKGELYRVAHINPATYPVDFDGNGNGWDGIGYRITEPYRGGPVLRNDKGVENMCEGKLTGEFRHTFSDIFNGLIETGMVINGVWEEMIHLCHDLDAEPGTEEHKKNIVQLYFSILAQKAN